MFPVYRVRAGAKCVQEGFQVLFEFWLSADEFRPSPASRRLLQDLLNVYAPDICHGISITLAADFQTLDVVRKRRFKHRLQPFARTQNEGSRVDGWTEESVHCGVTIPIEGH